MGNKLSAKAIWFRELGGHELLRFIYTLEAFGLISDELAQAIYDNEFEKIYKHWEHPRMG
jgi:hypothetical protein